MEVLSRYCVLVLKRGTAEDVETFAAQVAACDDKVLIGYQKHILLPFLSRIQNGPRNERLDLMLMDSLREVIKRLGKDFRDAPALHNVLLTHLMYICCSPGVPISEELKISFLELMSAVFSSIDEQLILEVYTGPESASILAPLFRVFVDSIDEKNKDLKQKAIRCLTLSYLSRKRPIVDIVKGFLPGIVCGLLRQVMDYCEKSQRIFNVALEALTDSITLVMSDQHDLGEQYYNSATPNLLNCATTLKRVVCPPLMSGCESSCKYFAIQLLSNCSRRLEIVIPLCLEILLTVENPNRIRAELFEELLSQAGGDISVEEKFSEYFDQLLTRMPRISAVGSRNEKVSLLRQLHGFLRLNPGTILRVLNNSLSRRKFFSCLFRLVALDRQALRLSAGEVYNDGPLRNVHRQIHCFDEEAFGALKDFCRTFAKALDHNLCRDLIMENRRHDFHYDAEAALIFVLLIENLPSDSHGFDQTINIILQESHERVFSVQDGVQKVPMGLYIIRGENVVLVGELDEEIEKSIDLTSTRAEPLNQVVH
ncbi:uncharacterized protein LOC100902037 [Galendromus occidentalis]|uniref:Uncharacterized protein LOC100902037 n=1 Tax=Galendromus occidentalis TaxID=34638 RepID=A0AAJ7SGU0_9ACAR|nr:uncharacterized protein LOC100902037 [Galendromus occidentalis]